MASMIDDPAPPRKVENRPPNLPLPGPALWGSIDLIRRRGRPVLRAADGLPVPLLDWTAEWRLYDSCGPEAAATKHYRRGLRPEAAAHLEDHRDGAERVASSPHASAQLSRLTVAAYRDIGGKSRPELAAHYGWSEDTLGYEHFLGSLRAETQSGRQLWAALGAWPWWPLAREAGGIDALKGRLPARWWERPEVVATFAAWTTGSQAPLRRPPPAPRAA